VPSEIVPSGYATSFPAPQTLQCLTALPSDAEVLGFIPCCRTAESRKLGQDTGQHSSSGDLSARKRAGSNGVGCETPERLRKRAAADGCSTLLAPLGCCQGFIYFHLQSHPSLPSLAEGTWHRHQVTICL